MKAFLDHYGYRWMVHSPEEKMFSKQGVCISTAAGAGMKSTIKDMADSMFYWGIPKIYRIGMAVRATDWDSVSKKNKKAVEKNIDIIAGNILKKQGKVKPGFKTRFFFGIMRQIQKNGWNERDVKYWKEKGWLDKNRHWKQK